jgi:hypothetical protein
MGVVASLSGSCFFVVEGPDVADEERAMMYPLRLSVDHYERDSVWVPRPLCHGKTAEKGNKLRTLRSPFSFEAIY